MKREEEVRTTEHVTDRIITACLDIEKMFTSRKFKLEEVATVLTYFCWRLQSNKKVCVTEDEFWKILREHTQTMGGAFEELHKLGKKGHLDA
jgi:hypothetical protein